MPAFINLLLIIGGLVALFSGELVLLSFVIILFSTREQIKTLQFKIDLFEHKIIELQSQLAGYKQLLSNLTQSPDESTSSPEEQLSVISSSHEEEAPSSRASEDATPLTREVTPSAELLYTDDVSLTHSADVASSDGELQTDTRPDRSIGEDGVLHDEVQSVDQSASRAELPQVDPPEPSEDLTTHWAQTLWRDLLGGSLITRVGALLILVGVGSLLSYVGQHYTPSRASSHMGALFFGCLLLIWGWRNAEKNTKKRASDLALQGAGLALSALTWVSAARNYELISLTTGLIGVFATLFMGGYLALRQRSVGLALTCILGAQLAPLSLPLINPTSALAYPALLAYFTALNVVILWLSFKASWRSVNLVGFIGTSIALLSWAASWSPELKLVTPALYPQAALAVTAILFTIASLAHSLRGRSRLRGWLDGGLLWGTPSLVLAAEFNFLSGEPKAQGISILTLSMMYALIWVWSALKKGEDQEGFSLLKQLSLRLFAVSIGLSVALIWGLKAGLIAWSAEGIGLAWLATRQQERISLGMGALFILIAQIGWWSGSSSNTSAYLISGLWIGISSLILARLLSHQTPLPPQLSLIPLVLGVLTCLKAQTVFFSALQLSGSASLILSSCILSVGFVLLTLKIAWRYLDITVQILAFCMGWIAIDLVISNAQERYFALITLAVLAGLIGLHREGGARPWSELSLFLLRGLGLALGMILLAVEVYEPVVKRFDAPMGKAVAALLLSLPLYALLNTRSRIKHTILSKLIFPLWRHEESRWWVIGPLLIVNLITQAIFWLTPPTGSMSLGPIINPVDVAQWVTAGAFCWGLVSHLKRPFPSISSLTPSMTISLTFMSIFIGLNSSLFRAYIIVSGRVLSFSSYFLTAHQVAVSLLWGVSALALMRIGGLYKRSGIWWGGLSLLILTLFKLWLLDLSLKGQLEHIFALLGVGSLLLLAGYWAPAPSQGDAPETPDAPEVIETGSGGSERLSPPVKTDEREASDRGSQSKEHDGGEMSEDQEEARE